MDFIYNYKTELFMYFKTEIKTISLKNVIPKTTILDSKKVVHANRSPASLLQLN